MENSIYLGLAKQNVLRTNLDIVANNVANMSTPGFRAQNILFEEYLSDPRYNRQDELSFVYDRGHYETTSPGPVKTTGNPLDVALTGPGFLGVVMSDGGVAYTRAGNFQLNVNGELTTSEGFLVAGTGGGAITIPRDATEIKIDKSGMISTQGGVIGQLLVAEFDNVQTLEAMGNNMYRTDAAVQPAVNTVVNQGLLEGSNVQPVVEMTRMIDLLRNFQSMQNVLQTENERLRTAIQRLTRQS